MKLSRILPLLLVLCVAPLGLSAQGAGPEQPANVTIQAAAGSVIVVDGQEVTVPDSGTIEVPAGATLSATSATRITLASGASVVLGSSATIQVDSASTVTVTSGSVSYTPADGPQTVVSQGQSADSSGMVVDATISDETQEGAPEGQNDGNDQNIVIIPDIVDDTNNETEQGSTVGQDPTQSEDVPTPL